MDVTRHRSAASFFIMSVASMLGQEGKIST